MEIKKWTYEEFPEFTEEVEGAERISITGEEMGVRLHLDVEYARKDGEILHLQILEPYCRKDAERIYPCLLYLSLIHIYLYVTKCMISSTEGYR